VDTVLVSPAIVMTVIEADPSHPETTEEVLFAIAISVLALVGPNEFIEVSNETFSKCFNLFDNLDPSLI